MNNKLQKINKIGRFVVDGLLLVLLWSILILPISSFSLLHYKSSNKNEVLSGQDTRLQPKSDDTKSFREYKTPKNPQINKYSETADYIYIYDSRGNR